MNDRTLLKIALCGSVIGVVALFILSSFDTEANVIAQIEQVPEGQEIDVFGVVTGVVDHGNVVFLTVDEQRVEHVSVVLFKSSDVQLKEGDVVRVIGSVDEYQGKKQVIGNRVERK